MIGLLQVGLYFAGSVATTSSAAITFVQNSESEYDPGSLGGRGAAHAGLGKIVVFGDSFSDNGTGAWDISGHTWPIDPAYYGHRFSNGPVWVENLADKLSMELDDSAVGGATTNNSAVQGFTGPNSTITVPSILDQLTAYLKRSEVNSEDLFIIAAGANDAFFKLTIDDVIPSITDAIYTLSDKGAKKFLIASYPDLGHLPLRAFSPASTSKTLEKLSWDLHTSLLALRFRLCRANDIQVGFVDLHSLFRDMLLTPIDYGFNPKTTGESCLVGAYSEAPRKLCHKPDEYIFWDEYHPTRVVHRYIGSLAWKASQVLCNNIDQVGKRTQ